MRVLIVYNHPVLPPTHPDAESEREILDAAQSIAGPLRQSGFELQWLPVGPDMDGIPGALQELRPDVVVNLFEGLGDDPHSECRFAQLLEEAGAAYTGCSSETLWRAGRKDIAKTIFQQAGIPTPSFYVVREWPLADIATPWPAFVKPTFRDASIGIDQESVVTDRRQLKHRVAHLADAYGLPVLVEEFIDGREISVAVTDWPALRVLPPVETLFVTDNGDWPIVTYDGKWRQDSRDYATTPLRYPADLTPAVAECLTGIARRAFRALDCRDFVTMDFRLGHDGSPYLLEVNPNPGLKPTTCLTDLFAMAGISYSDFLVSLVHAAIARQPVQFHS